MSVLYHRVLLWHKLIAQVTGGLTLCSAKHRLPRNEAESWAAALRNVADEIEEVLAGRPFILDDKGQRVIGSRPKPQFFSQESTARQSGPRTARRKTT